MNKEQYQFLKQSQQNQMCPLGTSRLGLSQARLGLPQIMQVNSKSYNGSMAIDQVRHVYLQEQNSNGRFTAYLLLGDKLPLVLDNSGHTVLHHMCSQNSQYLPLYLSTLKDNDPILNRPSKIGNTPLDIAGNYCHKEHVDMLLSKGAVDNGNIDQWAIQGGNIYNWTGKVDINKKHLIHWAAYNDMPQVLTCFYKQGANMSEEDANDFTPIDLAVINKSYKSLKLLVELGFCPKEQLVRQSHSKSINKILGQFNESQSTKARKDTLKSFFIPAFCIQSFLLIQLTNDQNGLQKFHALILFTLSLWMVLKHVIRVPTQPKYENTRHTSFHSDIISKQVNTKSNHLIYYLFNISIFMTGLVTLLKSQTTSYIYAVLYIVQFIITMVYLINSIVITYSIVRNLTHQQMFDSYKCMYLWNRIHFVRESDVVVRKFDNVLDKGIFYNLRTYFAQTLA